MSENPKPLSPAARKALVDHYEGFLRVGRVTGAEWEALDDEERACMLVAQRRIDVEHVLAIRQALGGPQEMNALLASVDGGAATVRYAIDLAVARYQQKAGAA